MSDEIRKEKQMLTKSQLCWIVVNKALEDINMERSQDLGVGQDIKPEGLEEYIYTSSQLAVALEYLNLIETDFRKIYASTRGGVIFCGQTNGSQDLADTAIDSLTLRDILSLLPE